VGYCRAIRVGDRISVSGTAPIGPDGQNVTGSAYQQAIRCLDVIREALQELGADAEHVVRTRVFLVDAEDWEDVGRAHQEVFSAAPPATSFIVAKALLDPEWRVEIEAEAEV